MSSQQVAIHEHRGRSTHQNEAHKLLKEAGYVFVRETAHNANLYRNEHGDVIKSVCSPRNNSRALNQVRTEIRRHARLRAQEEAHMNAQTTSASTADQLVAMADSFLATPLKPEDHQKSPAFRAKYAAYVQWVRRALERHAPIYSGDLEAATRRLGYTDTWFTRARKELGIQPMRERGKANGEAKWILYLPHQVPADRKPRQSDTHHSRPPAGVKVEREDEPVETISIGVPDFIGDRPDQVVTQSYANGNGKPALTDQQAAALMLLESLGIQSPGQEARQALMEAKDALTQASIAVEAALAAVA